MFCPHCGSQIAKDAKFCTSCGQSTEVASPAGTPPPPPLAAQTFNPPDRVEVRIGAWIGEAWRIVTGDLATFIVATLLFVVIAACVPIIMQGPLTAGLHYMVMRKLLTGRTEIGDLFKGFNFFVPALVAYILIAIFVFLGTLACLIPGLVVASMYFFTYLFIIDRKMEFWPAMQASHAIVKKNYMGFTLLLLAIIGVQILGVLCCLVGLLVTVPMHYAVLTCAYRDLVGFASKGEV